MKEDDSAAEVEDIQALYDAANDLPSDDPLHAPANVPGQANAQSASTPVSPAGAAANPNAAARPGNTASLPSPQSETQSAPRPAMNKVVVSDAAQLRVPSLLGLSVRQVIEEAGRAGLEVEITGSGTAHEQAPAPGTMVPLGTKVVVRCQR